MKKLFPVLAGVAVVVLMAVGAWQGWWTNPKIEEWPLPDWKKDEGSG